MLSSAWSRNRLDRVFLEGGLVAAFFSFTSDIPMAGDAVLYHSTPAMHIWLGLLGFVTIAAGCGAGSPNRHPITGKITFGNVPVEEGTITFEDPLTGMAERAELAADGTYQVTIPDGTYNVSIEPLFVERASNADAVPDYTYKPAPHIPMKYRSTAESGQQYTVSGPGTYDLDMNRGS